jgi:hypothetical protein
MHSHAPSDETDSIQRVRDELDDMRALALHLKQNAHNVDGAPTVMKSEFLSVKRTIDARLENLMRAVEKVIVEG